MNPPLRFARLVFAALLEASVFSGPHAAEGQENSPGLQELSTRVDAGQTYPQGRRGFAEFVSTSVGVGRFVSRRLEILLDAALMSLRQPVEQGSELRESATSASVGAGLRWYPAPAAWRVEPCLEIVEGVFLADRSVPASGTRFNFLTRIGGGVRLPFGPGKYTFVTYRWAHVSNANIRLPNPGWSFSGLSAGIALVVPEGGKP